MPGEGRWDCALLADGNIGIGGDPGRLLHRLGRIVRPGGRVVVELDADGTDVVRHRWRLRVGGRFTPVFDWAVVGLDAIERLSHATGFVVEDRATAANATSRCCVRTVARMKAIVEDIEKRIPRPDRLLAARARGTAHGRAGRHGCSARCSGSAS